VARKESANHRKVHGNPREIHQHDKVFLARCGVIAKNTLDDLQKQLFKKVSNSKEDVRSKKKLGRYSYQAKNVDSFIARKNSKGEQNGNVKSAVDIKLFPVHS
jgi:hypothetical protein